MNNHANLNFLDKVQLQEILSSESIAQMKNKPEVKKLQKGDFIYFPNDTSNKVFYIQKGRVKIGTYSDDGKEIILDILEDGELFGELALIDEKLERGEFAQAMGELTILVMPVALIRELMSIHKGLSLQITQMMGNKLVKMQRRLESLVFRDARSRIVEFLHNLAEDKGQQVGFDTLVKRFFTHQEIANLTGTSRQTVTTILNELRNQNLIYFDRKRLLVRDLKQLAAEIV